MDPRISSGSSSRASLPHPRGDGPAHPSAPTTIQSSPPPAWGWTRCPSLPRHLRDVSPTRVGMDPASSCRTRRCSRLPHPRGDGPLIRSGGSFTTASPPPAWGWTRDEHHQDVRADVSPTRVGMDPSSSWHETLRERLPHPRGDGPQGSKRSPLTSQSPPPAWGWTPSSRFSRRCSMVSPTRVGMDPPRSPSTSALPCLPHPRGDGPDHARLY